VSEIWPPKGLTRAVADISKATRWTTYSGMLACVEEDIAYGVYEFAGTARFLAKPVIWDRTLWHLLGMNRSDKVSPTFHYRGVNASVPPLAEKRLLGRTAEAVAAELLDFAEVSLAAADPAVAADFPALMARGHVDLRRADHVVTEAIWQLCEGRPDAAREIARAVVSGARRATLVVGATPVGGGRHRTIFEVLLDEFDDPTT
jgi:hypothetical protein